MAKRGCQLLNADPVQLLAGQSSLQSLRVHDNIPEAALRSDVICHRSPSKCKAYLTRLKHFLKGQTLRLMVCQ